MVEDTARIRSALIDRTDASCGLDNGRIVVTQINGGSPAYQYSFDNGKTFQANPDFNGLPQGMYQIKIKDRNGCTFDQTINIVTTSGVELDLIPEIQLQAGTQQTLNLIIKK
ncbi:MAG: SprB repeat-containing protein [Saprospiraceae bacterium]|nr:SprB repeat-containing protein [Candidatus Vicinibacter affinis]